MMGAIASSNKNDTMEDIPTCPVCYESFSEKHGEPSLSSCCQIPVCGSCMRQWVEVCVLTGASVTCPSCRSKLEDNFVSQWTTRGDGSQQPSLLGESNAAMSPSETREEETIDEFTRVWMEDHGIVECFNCGAHIEKTEGCGAVMCLCGFRLCWNCKVPEKDCECGDCGDRGDFFDNVWGSHVQDFVDIDGYGEHDTDSGDSDDSDDDDDDDKYQSYLCPRVATIDETFDLKSFLEERRKLMEENNML